MTEPISIAWAAQRSANYVRFDPVTTLYEGYINRKFIGLFATESDAWKYINENTQKS